MDISRTKTRDDDVLLSENPADPAEFDPVVDATDETVDNDGTPVKPHKPKGDHQYQIDFVRLVTFAGVVLDHVLLVMMNSGDIIANGIGLCMRYTRYCFFALTGFVLTYQYRHRQLDARKFWRRRFKLIGLPFLTWTIFYWTYKRWSDGGIAGLEAAARDTATSLKSLLYDLITGDAAHHLYFLSVSMQIYLIFPALLWLLRRTEGYHRYLLALAGAWHVWLMYHTVRPPLAIFADGPGALLWRHMGITVLPYIFFVLGGALAAYHFEAFTAFFKKWAYPLAALSIATIVATLMYYDHKVHDGEEMARATNVYMPHNMFAFLGIIVLLYLLGMAWQARRTPGSIPDRFLSTAADRSFAIYLAHVVVIWSVVPAILDLQLPDGIGMTFAYLVVCLLTVLIVEVLRRSPISLITTGRNRVDWRTQDPMRQFAVAVAILVAGVIAHRWIADELGYFLLGTGLLLVVGACAVLWERKRAPEKESVDA